MRCEIIKSECSVLDNNCSSCGHARKALETATKEYLERNNVVIPNFTVAKSTSTKDGSGTIHSMWFGNPIAEVANGNLKVDEQSL
ncbi:MAG: hypothetical protein US75_C0003G0028 [Candidatus Woesebacteria bacterium GW2011_GWC1_38_13]|uniref:Uncharacterized protein n=2 Tax=Candidatus Woeseibacteriota TaxID=1752722 RepID=A0A0G0P3A5_9BACT|nr:MAG: hypothetical protein US75_C0003G0028 [Candidatus Woesebacteria bacterium GW2011_GWC1_38_13]KKQ83756.1 MAG: hypothetical protein UT06_C0017G0032 [Candidatus Woesebacteria bacterium GW2011_GWA1_38_8]